MGLKPIVEFMTFNFAMQAMDHLINSAAKTFTYPAVRVPDRLSRTKWSRRTRWRTALTMLCKLVRTLSRVESRLALYGCGREGTAEIGDSRP